MDTNTDTKKRRTICFWVCFFFVVFAVCFRKAHRTSSWDWRCALELASWPTQQRVTRAGRFIFTRVRASDRIWSSQDRERLRALTWSRGAARCIYNILSTWSGLHWFKELWGWGIVSPAHFGLNTEYRCRHLEIFGSPLTLSIPHICNQYTMYELWVSLSLMKSDSVFRRRPPPPDAKITCLLGT